MKSTAVAFTCTSRHCSTSEHITSFLGFPCLLPLSTAVSGLRCHIPTWLISQSDGQHIQNACLAANSFELVLYGAVSYLTRRLYCKYTVTLKRLFCLSGFDFAVRPALQLQTAYTSISVIILVSTEKRMFRAQQQSRLYAFYRKRLHSIIVFCGKLWVAGGSKWRLFVFIRARSVPPTAADTIIFISFRRTSCVRTLQWGLYWRVSDAAKWVQN